MNLHITPIDQDNDRGTRIERARDGIVKEMAEHLVAAIKFGRLDTSSDVDVIECLLSSPQRYHHRLVLDLQPDALAEAKQILIAMEMSDI